MVFEPVHPGFVLLPDAGRRSSFGDAGNVGRAAGQPPLRGRGHPPPLLLYRPRRHRKWFQRGRHNFGSKMKISRKLNNLVVLISGNYKTNHSKSSDFLHFMKHLVKYMSYLWFILIKPFYKFNLCISSSIYQIFFFLRTFRNFRYRYISLSENLKEKYYLALFQKYRI